MLPNYILHPSEIHFIKKDVKFKDFQPYKINVLQVMTTYFTLEMLNCLLFIPDFRFYTTIKWLYREKRRLSY